MAADVRVYEISTSSVSNLNNREFCFETSNDTDLGWKMAGGKNQDGDVMLFLAKDRPAQVTTLTVSGSVSISAGSITIDTLSLSTASSYQVMYGDFQQSSTFFWKNSKLKIGATSDPEYKVDIESSSQDQMRLINNNTDSNPATLVLEKNSDTPVDDDEIGRIKATGNDDDLSVQGYVDYSDITFIASDVSSDNPNGQTVFYNMVAGTRTESIRLNANGDNEITVKNAASLKNNLNIKATLNYTIGRPRVLDLTSTDADLKGFAGGFTDGRYIYLVPESNGDYFGKVAKIDIHDFATVSVLDLTSTNAELKGFTGGFTDGKYGYFIPSRSTQGKVGRVDLSDFATVSMLDLTSTDADLKGFFGGFTWGNYGYLMPYYNGQYFGKIARIHLDDFATVSVLDLTSTDADLKGFFGGFTDGVYGYCVPNDNGSWFGKFTRFKLEDFSSVDTIDLTLRNSELKGFRGGFTDGRYAYLVPATYGKFTRIDLTDFNTVDYIDLTDTNAGLKGFIGGFTDGKWAYMVPFGASEPSGLFCRINLNDFSTIETFDISEISSNYKGYRGGIFDGRYSYFIPAFHASYHGNLIRFQSQFGGNL